MKKLLDSKFLFIVALSLIVLIILGIGAFYLFDDSDAVFVKDGYVLNPLSAKSEKYFFDEATSYKENLSSMIEFKDTDNIDVTILKDSFLHYTDGSLSFLKNGAILNLDSIDGTKAVEFYNITNKSLIEKRSKEYVIESKNGNIDFKNFIGRISDNKYIVVGGLEAKIPGNNTNIKADYFEIVYTDEGVINIENNDNKFQVTAEGTLIYAGDVVIDLGNKKITKNGEDVMSITAITIDGNENIEIIPKTIDEPSKPSNNNDNNTGNNIDDNNGNNNDNQNGGNGEINDGTNDNQENPNEGKEELKDILINLGNNTTVGSTYADLYFDIENKGEDDVLKLKVTNLDTGRSFIKSENVNSNTSVVVDDLTPGTKYLFTLENEKDGGKYYQKILETKDFGISFEKSYATDSSLAYTINVSDDSDVIGATLSIMKYDEIEKRLVPVEITKKDDDGNEIKEILEYKLTDLNTSDKSSFEKIFSGLDSNTLYTVVLNNIIVGGGNNGKKYETSETSLTLKKTPDYTNLSHVKGVDNKSFKLSIEGIDDPDNAIESYTYYVYEYGTNTQAIKPIVRTDASPIEVLFGNGENQLRNDDDGKHKYYYRTVIRYFDNERYVEKVTTDSINFSMGTEPHITVVPEPSLVGYNSIGAKIYIIDNSCTIQMPGRECDGPNTTQFEISYDGGNDKTHYKTLYDKDCDEFNVSDDEISCLFHLDGLPKGTKFYIDAKAVYDDSEVLKEIPHTEDSKQYIVTKSLSTLTVDWNIERSQAESSASHVIYIDPKLLPYNDDTTVKDILSSAETANVIRRFKVRLFEGNDVIAVEHGEKEEIASFTISNQDQEKNIKQLIYDERFLITPDLFGLTYDEEKRQLVNARGMTFDLKEDYTLELLAYYDGDKLVDIKDNIISYKVSPTLFIDDVPAPKIFTFPINGENNNEFDNINDDKINNYLSNKGIVFGYNVLAKFERAGLIEKGIKPVKIHFLVFDSNRNPVDFYVVENNEVKRVSEYPVTLGEQASVDKNIYMTYGNDYGVDDHIMRRGNTYYIGYYFDLDTGNKYPSSQDVQFNDGVGVFSEALQDQRQEPIISTYVSKSTADSITYGYNIKDPDKVIYKPTASQDYSFYYSIEDGEEKNVKINKVPDNYNRFNGKDLTLTLNKNDVYKLYYKVNSLGEDSITNTYVAETENGRLFDGYYDKDDYNFTYEVINNPKDDNKVIVKILAEDDILDRIVNYHVTLESALGTFSTDNIKYKTNLISFKYLQACEDDTIRCLNIDYTEFKKLKSVGSENKITVKVDAYYDTGITGFDLDYTLPKNKYMIFQNNNANGQSGKYVAFTSKGQITNWQQDSAFARGFYNFKFVKEDGIDKFVYKSLLSGYDAKDEYYIDIDGYHPKNLSVGTLNPKIVDVVPMTPVDGKDNFSFYSITPKIQINNKTRVINGAVINMNLTGIDAEELKQFCDKQDHTDACISDPNATKYLYVETWASRSDAENDPKFLKTVRKALPVALKSNPTSAVNAELYLLDSDTNYYYRVYAYMNKDGNQTYTPLFDAKKTKNEFLIDSFKSWASGDLFQKILDPEPKIEDDPTKYEERTIDYLISDDEGANYADKKLKTTIALNRYNGGVSFNFDIGYALCDTLVSGENDTCGIHLENERDNNSITNILEGYISNEDVIEGFLNGDTISDIVDISDKDLEFGRNYRVNIYAIYERWNSTTKTIEKKKLLLNRYSNSYKLRKLLDPSIKVARKASYDSVNEDFVIDLDIAIDDESRTITKNGKYFIKLLDKDDNPVGSLQVKEDGNWKTIVADGNYDDFIGFDAIDKQKSVRISGLKNRSNEGFTLIVSADAYLNNYSSEIAKEDRTKKIDKSYIVYTSNENSVAFGNVLPAPTANGLVLRFQGGSNLVERVCGLNSTVISWVNGKQKDKFLNNYSFPGDKFIEWQDISEWSFTISGADLSGDDLHFDREPSYTVGVSIDICDPETKEFIRDYSFEWSNIVYEDEKK